MGPEPGPAGAPLDAVFVAVYGTGEPTRAQWVSVDRAVRALESRGQIARYTRRKICLDHHVVITGPTHADCRQVEEHRRGVVGRPQTPDERAVADDRAASLMRALGFTDNG